LTTLASIADGCTVIEAIGTANPHYRVPQSHAADFMLGTEGLSETLRKRIPQVYDRSGINQRYTCLRDYTQLPGEFEFYPKSASLRPAPTTAARNQVYERESVPLALEAAKSCIEKSGIQPSDVTHLVVVSCTGFFAPGIDIQLVKQLGLPMDTARTVIGFMGCYAAFNGLKTAAAICRSECDALVMVVCVELCTLHFQIEDSLESVIVNALFSDGAAACLVRQTGRDQAAGKLIYRDSMTALDSDSLDAMSWEIGDTGFNMGLSSKVPELISRALPGYMQKFTQKVGISTDDIEFWAIHPGGRQVLDRAAQTLRLCPSDMADSYTILRDYGNMSSPTIMFILERIMQSSGLRVGQVGMALAFGPGLTIEGCLLEFGI
jgi:alpha-pyrone synthase